MGEVGRDIDDVDLWVGLELQCVEGDVHFADRGADLFARVEGRQDFHDDDLGLRAAEAEVLDAELDALGGGFDRDAVGFDQGGIVYTDFEYNHLGGGSFERPVVKAPEDVFHAVSTDAKIHGLESAELLLPGGVEGRTVEASTPALGDTVADQRDIDGAGGLHVRDVGRVVGKPGVAVGRILAAPVSGSRSQEPHFW